MYVLSVRRKTTLRKYRPQENAVKFKPPICGSCFFAILRLGFDIHQPHDEIPFLARHLRNAQPRLLQSLQILQHTTFFGVFLKLLQLDDLGKFLAELDVNDTPFRAFTDRLLIVVWM